MAAYCPTCIFSSNTAVHVGGVMAIAKLCGIPLVLVGGTIFALYLTFRMVLSSNQRPGFLTGYPSRDHIADQLLLDEENWAHSKIAPPLSTRGRYIVDADGQRFKLFSVNWYGASDELFVPGGLDRQHRQDIALTIRRLGFNSVRLPYSDELVRKNPVIAHQLTAANPDLAGLRALDIFEAVVTSLTGAGLAVIVNNHITQARWCCDGNLCDAQWSNRYLGFFCPVQQSEEQWIQNLETVMRPHISDPLVVGVDLRNEVRGPTGKLLWYSWADAAENAAERLHLMQPNWLMFVEGVSSANDISAASDRPIELINPNKVVYSAHVYGWSGWGSLSPYWKRSYESFAKDMQRNWAYLLDGDVAPVWIGEIGVPRTPNEGDVNYWINLVKYLELKDVDFAYWALNPRKPKDNEVETYGLLADDWKTPRYDYRLYDMRRMARPQAA